MKISHIRCAIFDTVWHSPKTRLSTFLRGKCDAIPDKHRLKVVILLFTVFLLTAFSYSAMRAIALDLGRGPRLRWNIFSNLIFLRPTLKPLIADEVA